jgi:RNA polymerase sigma-70 factor (family 1)
MVCVVVPLRTPFKKITVIGEDYFFEKNILCGQLVSRIDPFINYGDAELIQLWVNGDEAAFDTLYKRYLVRLLNTAFQKTNSRELAQELVQEVFMELYVHRSQLVIHTSLQGYLFTILRNKIFNYYRHELVQKKYRQFITLRGEQHVQDSGKNLEGKELQDKIRSLIQELPLQCRTVFLLSREGQMSNKEIADQLHISINTVEQHIRKARRILREALGNYEFGISAFVAYLLL